MPSTRPPPGFATRPQNRRGHGIGSDAEDSSAPIEIPKPRPRYPPPDWSPYIGEMWPPPTPDPAKNREVFRVEGFGGLAQSFRRAFNQPPCVPPSGKLSTPRAEPPPPPPPLQDEERCPIVIGFDVGKEVGAGDPEDETLEGGDADAGKVEEGELEVSEAQGGRLETGEVDARPQEGGNADGEQEEDGKADTGEIEAGEVGDGKAEVEEVEDAKVDWKLEVPQMEGGSVGGGNTEIGEMETESKTVENVEGGKSDNGDGEVDPPSEPPLTPRKPRKTLKLLGCIAAVGTIIKAGAYVLSKRQ